MGVDEGLRTLRGGAQTRRHTWNYKYDRLIPIDRGEVTATAVQKGVDWLLL